jgi:hypothetical protein
MPSVELPTRVELWPWVELLSWVLPVIPNCDSDSVSVLAVLDSSFMPSDGDED